MKAHQIIVLLLAAVFLSMAIDLYALHSDSFLIGAYSHIRSYSTTADCTDAIATKAREAGFNALICKSAYEIQNDAPTDMFNILNSDSLDVIFNDWIFYPNTDASLEKYGYSALSSGTDMKFEAEYADDDNVNPNDRNSDTFFYMSSSAARVGSVISNTSYSNGNYWFVPDSTSGYAYKDITYRWRRDAHYDRVGNEFRFLGETTNDVKIVENNKLTVRYVFRVDGLGSYSDSDTLAVFGFVKYDGMTTESTTSQAIHFYQASNELTKFHLTKAIYESLPVVADSDTLCRALEFEFPLKGRHGVPAYTLDNQGVISPNGWYMQMSNLNPWMEWSGKGALSLDYIEYFDDVFANYTDVAAERAKLRSFDSVANLNHYYGIDEPKAPNFESFKKLKEYLQTTFPVNERYIVAAINLDHFNLIKPDAYRYRLPTAYKENVAPRKLMIDVYPFTGADIQWNNSSDDNFVQNHPTRVCNEYDHFRTNVDNGVKLVFIPQTFGEYIWGDSWSYLLPPAKMARCLQLLPLCYQPDGVLSYKFDSIIPDPPIVDLEYQYALAWHLDNDDNFTLTPQYYEIQAANRKLLRYGPIVNSLSWVGSQTINTYISQVQNVPFIDSLQVVLGAKARSLK